MEKVVTVKAIKKLISESSQEFKAKLGPNVESKDKEINDKAYSDAKKRAKDFDGGLSDEVGEKKAKFEKEDFNKTTLDYEPENVTPEYKKRVHAQAKGYTSEAEMNNGIEKSGDFSDNENIYNGLKKSGEELHKNEKELKKSGLQAREWPDDVFDEKTMYESKEGFDMRKMLNHMSNLGNIEKKNISETNIKTVFFKKTEFLNESHMISKIPDDFKVNGTSFRMKDKNGNEYLIEWNNNKAYVVGHEYKDKLNEEFSRMKELMGYKTSDTKTNYSQRLNEGEENFRSTLNKVRNIKNEN